MTDYLYLRKATSSSLSNFYQNGVTAYTREGIGDWKAAYYSDTEHVIKMGVYRPSGAAAYTFVFTCSESLASIDIKIVSPTAVMLRQVRSINREAGGGRNGYYGYTSVVIDNPTFNYTLFSTLDDTLTAMLSSSPSPSSGVVVTVNASPAQPEPQPEKEGVVVTVLARLADPNDQGGTSEQGGGQGTFDDTSDEIPVSPLPTISGTNSGMITLFRPSKSELDDLGRYLWTHITDFIENLQKIFSNPMDYFVAFHIVPCVPEVGEPRNIILGLWKSNVSMSPILSQFYEYDFGTARIPLYWDSALDYAPYTKVTLFLPFIGSVSLNTDEVMNQQLSLKYRIDLLSGQCVALLSVNDDCLYQFTGECSVSIPLTGADWSRIYSAAIGATTAVVAGVAGAATAGSAAAGSYLSRNAADLTNSVAAVGDAFANVNATSKGVAGVASMRQELINAASRANAASVGAARAAVGRSSALRATAIAHTVNNVAGNIAAAKPNVQHTGNITGSSGMLGMRTPYLLVEYPHQSLAENYKHFVGYPSNMYANLSTLTGYTECESVIVSGINATEEEIAEISDTLKAGVYL